jgi:hypothetical protein
MPIRSLTDDRFRLPAAIVALTYFWSGGRFLTILIWRANYRELFEARERCISLLSESS